MNIDCLLLGFNDSNFADYVNMVKWMGKDSGAYRDLNLAFIEYQNRPYRALDILTHFSAQQGKPFHNMDFLSSTILYLGTYLARRGFCFDYINLFHLEKQQLQEKLEQNNVLSIAITTTLYVSPEPIFEIVSFIRQCSESVRIIIGGPYILNQFIMLDPSKLKQIFQYLDADVYVISQEGEAALVHVLDALKKGAALNSIENIAYKNGEEYIMTPHSTEINVLKENIPDYSLFPKEHIGEFISVRTANSCPFNCSYCGYSLRAGKYRYLSAESVEQELNAIRDLDCVTTLTFIDDTLNVPKKRFKDILRMMIRNNYGFKWNSYYRCDQGDEETIELMKEAGCEGVFLGIESGSNAMLTRMNKTARREDYLKAIPLLKKAGIVTHANVIVGFPGETHATVQETLELLTKTMPDFFRAQLWYADPITPIWNDRKKYNIKGSAFHWSHSTMNSHTACNIIDEKFFSLPDSIWLPQYGFELWSVFYLQRRGMTIEQVKAFVTSFNAIIQNKLLHPTQDSIAPGLLHGLKQSCRFDTIEDALQKEIAPVTSEELDML